MTESLTAPCDERISEPPGGWERFAGSKWEKEPYHFRAPFSAKFTDGNMLFRLLAKSADSVRKNPLPYRESIRFYVENSKIISELPAYLPRDEDLSLEGYASRVEDFLDGRDFTLIADNAQAFDFELWTRMHGFMSGLCRIIGIPLCSQVTVYLTTSRRTALGIHRDPTSNFVFQICGRKKFWMWPSAILKKNPHLLASVNYEEIAADATTADLSPGDLLYMPSDYYHLAEADGDLCAHASLLIATDRELGSKLAQQLVLRSLTQIVNQPNQESEGFDPFFITERKGTNELDVSLPAPIENAINAFTNLSVNGLEEAVREELTRISTAYGCEVLPPILETPATLSVDDLVEMPSQDTVAYRLSKKTLYFASNGRGFSCPPHPKIIDLIRALSDGGPYEVRWLQRTFSGVALVNDVEAKITEDDVKTFLEKLYKIRAIQTICVAEGSGPQNDSTADSV